ncbi:ABC transporter permease [Vagococcus acidifermentans]|uniref:ABC transporter permease n=1 Tax=Vagococcus acidifermentans TaxID=564710 RepID=A0A430B2L7_9ENTE|nr:ABC transporter permease [Vagococcus acidifermentans]RSU14564.1 ABC transporter permease [Vagococcus acidifermentans]
MISNLLVSTFLSLKAHKLRVFLTMIGIIIGIASVVTISTLGEGMKRQILSSTSALNTDVVKLHYTMQTEDSDSGVMYYEEPDFNFSRVDMKKVQGIEGVKAIYPEYGNYYGGDNLDVNMEYFNISSYLQIVPNDGKPKELLCGRDFSDRDAGKNVIILNHSLFDYDTQYENPEELLDKAVSINGYMYKVIGILAPFKYEDLSQTEAMELDWNTVNSSFVSRSSYNELSQTQAIKGINFKLEEGADKHDVLGQAIQIMQENHTDVKGVFAENDMAEQEKQQMEEAIGGMTMFLMAITAISLLVGGIGVMNIMYVSVTERKREIGIRRAIGAKPKIILMQFLLEAAFITLVGGLIGVAVGYGLSSLAGGFIGIIPVITTQIFLISAGVSILTGVFFGIIPAISASRMDPIKAIYN